MGVCPECDGNGGYDEWVDCVVCDGDGELSQEDLDAYNDSLEALGDYTKAYRQQETDEGEEVMGVDRFGREFVRTYHKEDEEIPYHQRIFPATEHPKFFDEELKGGESGGA
jgi:RecJ-like exonuclease